MGRFFVGKSSELDFVEPAPKLEREDNRELRAKILVLTASQARGFGIGKSTLHQLRVKARSRASFKVHDDVHDRLDACFQPAE